MSFDTLLEPLKGYKEKYKDEHLKNTEAYFDELAKKAMVNPEENKETVNKYNEKVKETKELEKRLGRKKLLRGFLIFFIILFFASTLQVIYFTFSKKALDAWQGILISLGLACLAIVFIFLIIKKLNPTIKGLTEKQQQKEKEAKELLDLAWMQMAPLNALFDWGISEKLFTKTVDLIKMDTSFDPYKYEYLHDKYGFSYSKDENVSTYLCQSGSILGNPFLYITEYVQSFISQRYEGSLMIHWTETRTDSKGHTQLVTRTQTLYASIYQPKPVYDYETYLVYGNDAAPNLTFHRSPTDVENMNEKQIGSYVKKKAKALDKKARKAVTKNQSYQRFGNDEFETIFGGDDRDNELEYRLLFTPLAQQNLLALMKTKDPFGDDFYMAKEKKLNYIHSEHSQAFDYEANPIQYVGYDFTQIRKKFIDYNQAFFKGVYFDLAPLMCIPVYQQHKTHEFIYDKKLQTNVSHYEHESMANSFDFALLKPDLADTSLILKTAFEMKAGKADVVNIKAHSFDGQKRVTYVNKIGGDGLIHRVPVHWIEYVPVSKDTKMAVETKNSSRYQYNELKNDDNYKTEIGKLSNVIGTNYRRGLYAALLTGGVALDTINRLNNIYKEETIIDKVLNNESIKKTIQIVNAELLEKDKLGKINAANYDLATAKLKDDSIASVEKEISELSEMEEEDEEVSNDEE